MMWEMDTHGILFIEGYQVGRIALLEYNMDAIMRIYMLRVRILMRVFLY